MAKYNGSVELISGITQANNQDFPLMESHAIQVDDEGTRLDEVLDTMKKGKIMRFWVSMDLLDE